jgi:hypothetical protein
MRAADAFSAASGRRRRCGSAALVLALLVSLWSGLGSGAARAHHRVDPAALLAGGLVIPNLTHGEMAVMARFAPAVLDLAAEPAPTDPTFRRIANYAALQRTYCLWGLVPGSLSDEASPFNECSHAWLAALRSLLGHMQDMPERAARARALAADIDAAMEGAGSADLMCRNSGAAFSTAQVIVPDWRDIPGHRPSLLMLMGLTITVGAALWTAVTAWRLPH